MVYSFTLTLLHSERPKLQPDLSNPATSLTEENGRMGQVVGINRLEKYIEKLDRLGVLAGLDRISE